MESTEWLSRSAAELAIDFLKDGEGPHCDVAIVGSGYGGAVAAARLAGAVPRGKKEPVSVWVLERGREFLPGSFPERFADVPTQVRVNLGEEANARGELEGLFDLRIGKHVSTLLGNGLGGGSLINAGVLAEPGQTVLRQWPAEFHGNALDPYFQKARQMLGASKMPGPVPAKLAAIEMIGRKLDGLEVDRRCDIAVSFADGTGPGATNPWGVHQRGCIGCGDCFAGCNHGAKNTLASNYLALARRRGAEIFTGITVLKVSEVSWALKEGGTENGWELELCITDRKADRRFRNEKPVSLRLRARNVILAAGAYGSTGILLRSQGGLDLSDRVGEGFSTNGDMIAIGHRMPSRINASAQETIEPHRRDIGPTITGMIDLRGSDGLVIEELAIPAILRRMFEETLTTLGSLHRLAHIDWSSHRRDDLRCDPAAIDPEMVARTAVYATMGHDGSTGKLELIDAKEGKRSDDAVRVKWDKVASEPVFARAVEVLEKAHAGTGATVIPNPMWRLLPSSLAGMLDQTPDGSVFTVHPLGGCCLASSVGKGVVNGSGQVFRKSGGLYDTLAVLDGSIVPGSLGINPCLTIAALAEKASLELADKWGLVPLDDADLGKRLPDPPPLLPWPGQKPAHRPTAVRLAERLDGKVRLPLPRHFTQKVANASLEIEYTPVPNLEAFVSAQPKIMRVARGRLTLTGTVQDAAAKAGIAFNTSIAISGQLRMLVREDTNVFGRIFRAGWAWFWNRGLRDFYQRVVRRQACAPAEKPKSLWQRVKGLFGLPMKIWSYVHGVLAMASHAGEVRRIEYELEVVNDVAIEDPSGRPLRLFFKGDRLHGVKRLCYARGARRGSNPWNQLNLLSLSLVRAGECKGCEITDGPLRVDLPYFVTQYATQLQLVRQQDQPAAIADLLSFAAYVGRTLGKIHLWNFRAPDYPCPFPEYVPGGFDKRRLPRRIKGLEYQITTLHPDQQQPEVCIRLTRYWRGSQPAPGKPVLLIHGFGASGSTFTLRTVDKNLVQHLVDQGFDPWVLDLRTSIGMPSSGQDWTFDEIAKQDIPAAIKKVWEVTGRRVYVIAHCIGAAMFCMAALAGKLGAKESLVRAAVLSQVGPLLDPTPLNRFRGHLAGYLKHYFNFERFNVTGDLGPRNRLIDRLLAAYPYPEREWRAHHPSWFWETASHEVYCNRASAIYGRLFEHANLNEETLERFGELIGHVNYRTYQQTINYATVRRLTDNLGRNTYVTYENIRDHFRFPVCFLHGRENDLFDVRTSRRSFDLLASIYWTEDLEQIWNDPAANRADYSQYAEGKHLRLLEIEGYGHQDCMIGQRAHIDVFPRITAFLDQAPAKNPRTAATLDVIRPARMGPIVGWLRLEENVPKVRLLFSPNSSRSQPLYAMSIVLQQGKPVPGHADFHPLVPGAPTQALDVQLPPDLSRDCHVVVVTVHKEAFEGDPQSDVSKPREDDPFGEDLDRFPGGERFPGSADEKADPFVDVALACCKDLGIDREPLIAGRRVCDRRYATPVSVAIVSSAALQATRENKEKSTPLSFALASCRYAAAVTDRELADEGFGRLRDLLAGEDNGRPKPQLLFLAGDQIYADATAGLFDPTLGIERYDQRYLEAWTAPNAREVLRRVPVYPMLDDHEVEENWEGQAMPGGSGNITLGKQAFVRHQLLLGSRFRDPRAYNPDEKCYWYEVNAGGFGFFVADTRTGRCRGSGTTSIDARILAEDQTKALISWLGSQDISKPKFIVSPSVVAPWSRSTCGRRANALRADAWDGFPDSLHALFHFISENEIRNVVFLSGDYHSSLFCEISTQIPGRQRVKSFSIVSSGLYSPYPFANTHAEDLQFSFRGTHAQWQGIGKSACCPSGSELSIEYSAMPYVAQDSFALITVAKSGKQEWRLGMQFHTEDGLVEKEVSLS